MELFDDEFRGYTDLACPLCKTGLPSRGAACQIPGCPCFGQRGEQARATASAYRQAHPAGSGGRFIRSSTTSGAEACQILYETRDDPLTAHTRAKDKQEAEAAKFEAYISRKMDAELWAKGERVNERATRFHPERRP